MFFRNQHGIALPFFALMLTASIGLGAMVIDVSQTYSTKTRVQNSIDLSTLAGASQMYSGSSVSTVKNTALTYLNDNLSMTLPGFQNLTLTSPNLTIELGVYDSSAMTFTVNETIASANALRIAYTHTSTTFLAPIFMIDSVQISDDSLVVKKPAGYVAPGSGFPLTIYSSALTSALSNGNMVDLYNSGSMDNSFWTDFTDSNPSTTDIRNVVDYFQYGTGTQPPGVTVNDDFAINDGGMGGIYNDLEPAILEGMTFIFPVIEDMASMTAMAQGFVAGTIDEIYDSMGNQYISITIIPKYIDNTYGGAGPGPGVGSIGSSEQELLSNAYGIVQ